MAERITTVIGNRKDAVNRLAEITGEKAVYTRAPRFAYEVGAFSIERDGAVTALEGTDLQALRQMATEGLLEPFEGATTETSTDAQGAGEGAESAEGAAFTISIPKDTLTWVELDNLRKIVAAKGNLIQKALNADRIGIRDGERIEFPWWDTTPTPEETEAYISFISALCTMAKTAKRVTAKEKAVDSEKYAFRCFLLRLGFIGAEHKAERKILMKRLSGSAAFVNKEKADIFTKAQKAKRDFEKAQKANHSFSKKRADGVTTICYGEKRVWESRKEAADFFRLAIAGTDGSECERYCIIYEKIKKGMAICTDSIEEV